MRYEPEFEITTGTKREKRGENRDGDDTERKPPLVPMRCVGTQMIALRCEREHIRYERRSKKRLNRRKQRQQSPLVAFQCEGSNVHAAMLSLCLCVSVR